MEEKEVEEIVVNDKNEIRIVSWDNVESAYDEDCKGVTK